MKNLFKISLLAASVALTFGCDKKTEEVNTEQAKTEQAAPSTFKSEQEKSAYAVGVSFSTFIERALEKPAEFGMPLDKEVILQGITESLHGDSKLTEEQMIETLKAFDVSMKAAMKKQIEEKMISDKAESAKYLEENAKKDGVMVTESGLQYKVITKADGEKPKASDQVTVNYVGTLVDGTEFDSSIKRGQPLTFPLNGVIPGWTEGLQLMNVGEKFQFVIPAELAYGDNQSGPIPAGSTLIFDVELISIGDTKTAK